MDMSMGSNSMASVSASAMRMVFFTSTSTPLFSTLWTPDSTPAYAGTCIFLIILGAIFRGLLAYRASLERRWLDREFRRRYITVDNAGPTMKERLLGMRDAGDSDARSMVLSKNGVEEDVVVVQRKDWVLPPWRISTEGTRAVIDTVVAGVGYLL